MNNNRGQQNRGRGRGGSNRRNFGSDEVEQQEAQALVIKTNQINEKKNQPAKPVDTQKKEGLIEKGKAWINKHFSSMEKKDHGNIKVTFNDDIDYELYDVYERKLHSITSDQYIYETEKLEESKRHLKPLINVLIAIKLIKANTQTGYEEMKKYQSIGNLEIKGPKRLLAFIDNFGKSDAMYDNVIRLKGHNTIIKRRLFNAIIDVCGSGTDDNWDDNYIGNDNFTFENVATFRKNHIVKKSDLKLYDVSKDGVKLINSYGQDSIIKLNNTDIQLNDNDNEPVYGRPPFLDPMDFGNIEKIMSWELKLRRFFTQVKYDYSSYARLAGSALLGTLKLKWLNQRDQKLKTINNRFENTVFGELTPDAILKERDFYPIEDFMSEDNLVDNVIHFIDKFQTSYRPIFEMAYDMMDYKPTSYGSAAQVITGHKMKSVDFISDEYDQDREIVGSKPFGISPIKMKDEEALLGSIFKLNSGVEFKSLYEIFLTGKTKEIKMEYFNKDFR